MTAYDEIVLADSPVLYLPLDDTSGTTAAALRGSSGTYTNGPTLGQAGPGIGGVDAAVAFDGSNDHVAVPNTPAFSSVPMSVEAWVYINAKTGTQGIIGKNAIAGSQWALFASTSGIGFNAYRTDGGIYLSSEDPATTAGEWHHVVGTLTATQIRLFVDGVEKTGSSSPAGTRQTDTGGNLTVGVFRASDLLFPFAGRIAAAALYPYALSPAQILEHYHAAPPPFRTIAAARAAELGAVLHLPLDDEGGTTARATIGDALTYYNGTTLAAAGPSAFVPAAASFDGIDDHAKREGTPTAALPSGTSPFTLEIWVYPTSTARGAVLAYGTHSSSGQHLVFQGGSGGAAYAFTDGVNVGNNLDWATNPPVGAWTLLAMTYNAGAAKLYQNGTLNASATIGLNTSALGASSVIAAGVRSDFGRAGANWNGRLAAASVYPRALTAAELRANYLLGLDPRGAGSVSPVRY